MAKFEDNCSYGATDNSPGVCNCKDCIVPKGQTEKSHIANHNKNCHVACKAPGYTNTRQKRGRHRK